MTDKPLAVIHIASGDLWAGAEVQLFMLARAQRQLGEQVSAILLNPGTLADKLAAEGIVVHVLPEADLSTPVIFLRLVTLVSRLSPDIVHTHRLKENLLGSLAAWLNRIPSVRTQHGAPEFTYGRRQWHKRLLNILDRWVGRHLQRRVIAVTRELAVKLRADFPASHVTVIENGIDPAAFTRFAPGESFTPSFARAKRRVGIVGRLVPVKRVDLFIDAAALLMANPVLQDVEFFVIGDGPLRKALEQQAAPFRERLHFLGDISTVHPYIEALDVLVMCSDHEGLPMTLLEAMTLSVPVVGHEVGGIAQLLERGRNGWPVSHQDPLLYREHIRQALNDGNRSERVLRAKDNVSAHFQSRLSAQKCISLYQGIVHY